ncbi:MAG: dihydroorotate dehydrogenase electron transfer subunit [Candidatus Helarchaeota archaeon]
MINKPIIVEIKQVQKEAKNTFSLQFQLPEKMEIPRPGQFLMIWVPGTDEIPISIAKIDESRNTLMIIIRNVGETTGILTSSKKGDEIGIRGPMGNGFRLEGTRPLLIGGGIGVAPLIALTDKLLNAKMEIHFINGAKTKDDLVFHDYLRKKIPKYHVTTDDGTMGFKGFTTDKLKELINNTKFDQIYTCGPEIMMKTVLDTALSKNIPIQANLERIFKCGMGLCGHCVLDPTGLLTCKDGPVFSTNQLKQISDFGTQKRDFNGKKIPI